MVLFVLLNRRKASNGVVHVLVNWTLSAPWRAIYKWCAVRSNPYHGVIVVYQCAAWDVCHPHVAVCALSLSTNAKEHVTLAVVLYY